MLLTVMFLISCIITARLLEKKRMKVASIAYSVMFIVLFIALLLTIDLEPVSRIFTYMMGEETYLQTKEAFIYALHSPGYGTYIYIALFLTFILQAATALTLAVTGLVRVLSKKGEDGSNKRFDYDDYENEGARVIAIGGMVLSRGLTLEGLMVSYYSRNAGTYDTLLQMCRWFGYRPGYRDLCRVYVSQKNIDCFDAVLTAVEDLKSQFQEMKIRDKKPIDFGVMITSFMQDCL